MQAIIAAVLRNDALQQHKLKAALKFCHDFYSTLKSEERRKVNRMGQCALSMPNTDVDSFNALIGFRKEAKPQDS